ncbi:MAG: tyrosine-type recombinase/integrase [Bdellovibrionaceae bacterium]|nr:tyrosine-type recombinase/integrase [Pseudobdellovibrionaceae bacterium]
MLNHGNLLRDTSLNSFSEEELGQINRILSVSKSIILFDGLQIRYTNLWFPRPCAHTYSLYRKRRPHQIVKFVSFAELQKILERVEAPELKALYLTLFGTGMRLGEAFTINARSLKKNGTIYVDKQLTKNLKTRDIKNSKPHHTILLDICKKGFEDWAKVENKEEWRKCCQHPLINASRKSFTDPIKQISPHSLRHSYCIHLIDLGVSLDKVAKLIGDSIKTTEEYYTGFVVSDNEVDLVKKVIGQK